MPRLMNYKNSVTLFFETKEEAESFAAESALCLIGNPGFNQGVLLKRLAAVKALKYQFQS